MDIRELSIPGAFEVTPEQRGDARGLFLEWYRADRLAEVVGHPLALAQANLSVSSRGVVRGIHYAQVPPGQAKYVTCPAGRVLDVMVDLRVGSPTFGRWDSVVLDDTDRRAVYLPEGVGHGFCALSDVATVTYLCSAPYAPSREHSVNAFDPALGIDWRVAEPTMSDRDIQAPSLADAERSGLLPDYQQCLAFTASLPGLSSDNWTGRRPS